MGNPFSDIETKHTESEGCRSNWASFREFLAMFEIRGAPREASQFDAQGPIVLHAAIHFFDLLDQLVEVLFVMDEIDFRRIDD
jgi:hypothetical protein